MGFKLSTKSLERLKGVHDDLVCIVMQAAATCDVEFIVLEGVRSLETQKEYFAKGVTRTMNSRHLTGHAVDLVPLIAGQPRWEWPPLYQIAAAMDAAATELNHPLRWGGVWDKLLSQYGGSAEAMKKEVAAYCVRHPGPDFLDGPHFELPVKQYP